MNHLHNTKPTQVHSLEGHPDIAPLIQAGKLAVVGACLPFPVVPIPPAC